VRESERAAAFQDEADAGTALRAGLRLRVGLGPGI
jgi:hypothetical protein